MTTIDAPLTDRILARAARIDLRRVLLWVVVAVPFVLAWLAGKTVAALWVVWTWVQAAMGEAYRLGRGEK